jgi:hypothetical protein
MDDENPTLHFPAKSAMHWPKSMQQDANFTDMECIGIKYGQHRVRMEVIAQ